MAMNRPRVLLAGTSMSLLAAYQKPLSEEFEIIGTSADGRALMATAIQLQPSVIVVDLGVPPLTEAGTRLELKKLIPQTRFLVITEKEDLDAALQALGEWASGVVLRKTARRELLCALRKLMADEVYLPASIVQDPKELTKPSLPTQGHKALTRRQREVLKLLAEGRTMKDIAELLRLSTSTVAFHKYKIKHTFGFRSNVELLRLAIREDLTSAE
jgi:DNA-binding NarL/FixJ family response regulator